MAALNNLMPFVTGEIVMCLDSDEYLLPGALDIIKKYEDKLMNDPKVYALIFLNTISIFTPYTKGGCYLYGFILGLISFCFSFIDINLGVYLISLILSFTSLYFDKLILKISSK